MSKATSSSRFFVTVMLMAISFIFIGCDMGTYQNRLNQEKTSNANSTDDGNSQIP